MTRNAAAIVEYEESYSKDKVDVLWWQSKMEHKYGMNPKTAIPKDLCFVPDYIFLFFLFVVPVVWVGKHLLPAVWRYGIKQSGECLAMFMPVVLRCFSFLVFLPSFYAQCVWGATVAQRVDEFHVVHFPCITHATHAWTWEMPRSQFHIARSNMEDQNIPY